MTSEEKKQRARERAKQDKIERERNKKLIRQERERLANVLPGCRVVDYGTDHRFAGNWVQVVFDQGAPGGHLRYSGKPWRPDPGYEGCFIAHFDPGLSQLLALIGALTARYNDVVRGLNANGAQIEPLVKLNDLSALDPQASAPAAQ